MGRLFTFLAVVAFVSGLSLPAQADCAALVALTKGNKLGAPPPMPPGSDPRSTLTRLAGACDNRRLTALVYDVDAARSAKPASDAKAIAGAWVNQFWLSTAAGLVIPVVEMLTIAPDGTFTRHALRWHDPQSGQKMDDPKLPAREDDLIPLLAQGRLQGDGSGAFAIHNLKTFDVELEGNKRLDKSSYEMRMQIVRTSMPDFGGPLQVSRAGDVLAIKDHTYRIRTYKVHDGADVRRAHGLILALEISASRYWPCILGRFNTDNPDLEKMRGAGDHALKLVALRDALQRLAVAAENAADGMTAQDAKAIADRKARGRQLYLQLQHQQQAPEGAWMREQAKGNAPLGCPKIN